MSSIPGDIDERAYQCDYCGAKLSLRVENENALNARVRSKEIDADKEISFREIEAEEDYIKQASEYSLKYMALIFAFVIVIVLIFGIGQVITES